MTFDLLIVRYYAGIATALVQLGDDLIKFQCAHSELRANLDKLEDIAIGALDRSRIAEIPILIIPPLAA